MSLKYSYSSLRTVWSPCGWPIPSPLTRQSPSFLVVSTTYSSQANPSLSSFSDVNLPLQLSFHELADTATSLIITSSTTTSQHQLLPFLISYFSLFSQFLLYISCSYPLLLVFLFTFSISQQHPLLNKLWLMQLFPLSRVQSWGI